MALSRATGKRQAAEVTLKAAKEREASAASGDAPTATGASALTAMGRNTAVAQCMYSVTLCDRVLD
jgi:hypothetical protein